MTDSGLSDWIAGLPRDWVAGVDPGILERAHAAYGSPGRHYHTWEHVLACVERLRSTSCENCRAVFLALVFHDAVYVVGAPDNEAQSARLARDVLSECGVDGAELADIERMIRSTQNHHAHAGTASADEATLLDIDLSILAVPREEYARYARAIHDEWVPVAASESAFRIGRLEFLRSMLAQANIYLTDVARRRWDHAARGNMEWEVGELTNSPVDIRPKR